MAVTEVRRLWLAAMDVFGAIERHALPPAEERRAWMFVFFVAKKLLRIFRKSHGRLPKPPGLEELQEEAAAHIEEVP